MNPSTAYRLRLAQGFLKEAEQDWSLRRWRACVAHAQLAVENALKAVISIFVPVARTHNPASTLLELTERGQIPEKLRERIRDLAQRGRLLGSEVHVRTDYGDEFGGMTPWELFPRRTPPKR